MSGFWMNPYLGVRNSDNYFKWKTVSSKLTAKIVFVLGCSMELSLQTFEPFSGVVSEDIGGLIFRLNH